MSDKTLNMRKAIKGESFEKWLKRQRAIDLIQIAERTVIDTGEDLLDLGEYPFQIMRWAAHWHNLIGTIEFWAEEPKKWPSIYNTATTLEEGRLAIDSEIRKTNRQVKNDKRTDHDQPDNQPDNPSPGAGRGNHSLG